MSDNGHITFNISCILGTIFLCILTFAGCTLAKRVLALEYARRGVVVKEVPVVVLEEPK
jgi:hypothetical protein